MIGQPQSQWPPPAALLAIVTATLLLAVGCAKNPFSTRDAAPPTKAGGTFVTPVDPDIALDNIVSAYTEINIANYTQSLSDGFAFVYDFSQFGGADTARSWGHAEELRVTRNLFDDAISLSLVWATSPSKPDQESDSSAVAYRVYEIVAVLKAGSKDAPNDTLRFQGESELSLGRDELGLWSLIRWEDFHATDGGEAWSDLKNRFR